MYPLPVTGCMRVTIQERNLFPLQSLAQKSGRKIARYTGDSQILHHIGSLNQAHSKHLEAEKE
jgi:hypothetical protein